MADFSFFYLPLYAAMLFSAIVAHEYGHYFVCRRLVVPVFGFHVGFGMVIKKWVNYHGMEIIIRVLPLGGHVEIMALRPRWAHGLIFLTGPFVNLLTGGVCLLMLAWFPEAMRTPGDMTFLAWLLMSYGYLNLFLGFTNLLPCGKLDGGQVVMLAAKLALPKDRFKVFQRKFKAIGMAPYWGIIL